MAVSSILNPGTIVKERPTTAAAAQNFITGGSPLGQGVVASAANKIVGFQRGAAAVAARPPDLQSIIKTLSTNILTNVENRVQSINQNVTQLVNSNLKGLGEDYKSRLNQIDSARPNSILSNFLNLYKEAIGYIQFLGNRRNVKTLGDNLRALQNVFTETFNIAREIRQTILRIVKQLSNLPNASTGPGGLNLDVNVPGGGLKRSAPRGLMRMMRRRPGMMLGGAALAGGLGSQVVSGMLDMGGDVQAAPMSEGTIPTTLLDRFNGILDRFSAAINALAAKKPSSASSPTSSEGTTTAKDSGEKTPSSSGGIPTGEVSTEGLKGNNNAEKIYNQLIQEGFTPQAAAGVVGNIMQESGADPTKQQYGGGPGRGLIQWGTGKGSGERYDRLTAWAKKNGKDPLALETQYQYMMMEMQERGTYRRLKGVTDVNQATLLFEKEMTQAGKPMMENRYKFAQSAIKQYGSGTLQSGKPGVAGKPGEKGAPGKPGVAGAPGLTPSVAPAQTQATTQQQIAKTVSQPPTQQAPQITVAPMNMASPQTQSTPSTGKAIPPPAMSKGGATVPFLSSSNDDNFLSLYSKLVYNIIDG